MYEYNILVWHDPGWLQHEWTAFEPSDTAVQNGVTQGVHLAPATLVSCHCPANSRSLVARACQCLFSLM